MKKLFLAALAVGLPLFAALPAAAQAPGLRTIILSGVRPAPQGGAGGGGGGAVPVYVCSNSGAISTTSTSVAISKGACSTPTAGTLLLFFINMSDNSGTDHNISCAAAGLTPFSWSDAYDSGGGFNLMGCYKIATGSEPSTYTPTWTTGNTQAAIWVYIQYTGANATTPIEATSLSALGTTSPATPSISSGGANRLLVSCVGPVGSSNAISASPGSMTLEFSANPGALVRFGCAGETVGSGLTGTRTWTTSQGNPVWALSFLLQP